MAKLIDVESIASYFQSLSDPRHTRNRKHRLADIAVICVAAIVCGCDGPTAIHRWAVNQPKLHAAITAYFDEQLERDFEDLRYRHAETTDEGHGRIDERAYYLAKVPRDFAPADDWPDVKAIGYAIRLTTHADGRESCEVRYYISTRYLSGKRFAEAVRSHWAIESVHWTLDVTFREDDSRTRERTLGNNLGWLRRFAVTLLKRHPINDSTRGKMLRCGYNTDFLAEVLQLQQV